MKRLDPKEILDNNSGQVIPVQRLLSMLSAHGFFIKRSGGGSSHIRAHHQEFTEIVVGMVEGTDRLDSQVRAAKACLSVRDLYNAAAAVAMPAPDIARIRESLLPHGAELLEENGRFGLRSAKYPPVGIVLNAAKVTDGDYMQSSLSSLRTDADAFEARLAELEEFYEMKHSLSGEGELSYRFPWLPSPLVANAFSMTEQVNWASELDLLEESISAEDENSAGIEEMEKHRQYIVGESVEEAEDGTKVKIYVYKHPLNQMDPKDYTRAKIRMTPMGRLFRQDVWAHNGGLGLVFFLGSKYKYLGFNARQENGRLHFEHLLYRDNKFSVSDPASIGLKEEDMTGAADIFDDEKAAAAREKIKGLRTARDEAIERMGRVDWKRREAAEIASSICLVPEIQGDSQKHNLLVRGRPFGRVFQSFCRGIKLKSIMVISPDGEKREEYHIDGLRKVKQVLEKGEVEKLLEKVPPLAGTVSVPSSDPFFHFHIDNAIRAAAQRVKDEEEQRRLGVLRYDGPRVPGV